MKPTIFSKSTLALFCIILYAAVQAQVCTGSLGDPVVNITFGSGSNPGNPLELTTTTYPFTTTTCPDDGVYTIVNSTSNCFDNSWHSITEDHTLNDTNGYMMLVNGSFNPGDFYVDTVNMLCANTTYEFSAWILNVLLPGKCFPNPILPELVFTIETTSGTVLGRYTTGGIQSTATPTWTQYGLFFKTPDNTSSVVIRLTNTAPGGCGNDIALDDITFRPCGPSVTAIAENDQTHYDLCEGADSVVNMSAKVSSGYTAPALQWQQSLDNEITWNDITGATTLAYQAVHPASGVYKYRLAIADGSNISIKDCRVASNIVTITSHERPVVTATNDGPACVNTPVKLMATGGASYAWIGPDNFSSTLPDPGFITQNQSQGTYAVIATDQFGCVETASTYIIARPAPVAAVSSNSIICEGDSVLLMASGGSGYLWFPGTGLSSDTSGSTVARPLDSVTYNVVVVNNDNCSDTASVTINVRKKPIADAGEDKAILKGQSVMLNGAVQGTDVTHYWSPPQFLNDPVLLNPLSTPTYEMKYTFYAISNHGCGQSSDEVVVKVFNDIYIPKAFSPNNDGLNDTWRINALAAFPDAKLRVYNRYGQLVFESTSNNKDWNGSYKNNVLPMGAYTYLLDLKNERPLLKGMVVLIR